MKNKYLWLIPVAFLGLTGCAPLLVGGGAAAGYYVGQDERTLGEMTDDTTITVRIKNKYLADEAVDAGSINVESYRGAVTLYGSVPSQEMANRAVELARSTAGVKQVDSSITVVPKQ